jgi:hypothetical protein
LLFGNARAIAALWQRFVEQVRPVALYVGRFREPFFQVAAGDWFGSQQMGPHSPREAPPCVYGVRSMYAPVLRSLGSV